MSTIQVAIYLNDTHRILLVERAINLLLMR